MSFKARLATLIGMATLAGVAPAVTKEQVNEPTANATKSVETSFVQKTWGYSGGLLGTGFSYLGKGINLVGEGISWTFDKSMIPLRKTGEVAKDVGNTLAKGPEWVEDKTGIPMETPASILRSPGNIIFSFTDNTSDLLKDAPKASLGMVGSSVNLFGETISADTNGILIAAKDLGNHTLDLGMTAAGDALPLGLQAVGFITGTAAIPHDAIVRDGLAAAHRTTDLITGQSDLSKPVPKDVFSAAKYTYDRITEGKAVADAKGGSFFASTEQIKKTQDNEIDPNLLIAMKNKKVNGG